MESSSCCCARSFR